MKIRHILAAATLAGAAVFATLPSSATIAPDLTTTKAGQGFIQDVGSKHLIGYFMSNGGSCAVTVVMAERVDPDLAPGAGTAMRMALVPGADAQIVDDNGAAMKMTCGADAASLVVVPVDPKA